MEKVMDLIYKKRYTIKYYLLQLLKLKVSVHTFP